MARPLPKLKIKNEEEEEEAIRRSPYNMNSPETCTEIVKCLGIVWTDKKFLDFTIKIHDDTITCHKLVLAACSEFFQALFRSGMREVTENCVELKDVSYEIFQLILKTLYTGVNVLTLDNFTHVWRAVHMLQINFMIKMCERFANNSITMINWENIYVTANLLGSTFVLDKLQSFMLRNFEKISISATYLQLPFNEVRDLIKSQDLCVSSEDLVLESVIRWVECYAPNNVNKDNTNTNKIVDTDENGSELEKVSADNSLNVALIEHLSRKDKLTDLLSLVRTYLVTPAFLSRVYHLKMCFENKDFRDIIVSALTYQAQPSRDGQWPSAAMHRSCSSFTHVGVYAKRNGQFRAIRASDETWFPLPICDGLKESIQLVTFDSDLYAIGKPLNMPNTQQYKLFVLSGNAWKEIFNLPCNNVLLVSHGQFIYILDKSDNLIYHINPRSLDFKKFTKIPTQLNVKNAIIFENSLLLFSSETQNNIENTVVHNYDLPCDVCTKLTELDGPADQLNTFKNDKHSYILQTNGSLWVILNASLLKRIEIKFVSKLWDCQRKQYGALTYNEKLIIFGNLPDRNPPDANRKYTVPGHLKVISYWGHDNALSNFVPATLPKTSLLI
ncbi:kelch-like protein 8 [Physella acuta]|uniref:kelch-like protein 8 n=1 Tax=Physella acuta TaxID=109671 RepID=UPI0027DC2AAA|nr:kelch-like protein 8 [Physella acuta]